MTIGTGNYGRALAQPSVNARKFHNGHDYYVALMQNKLSSAQSLADVYHAGTEVMQDMENSETDTGRNSPRHVWERGRHHEHSRTRTDLKKLVADAIVARGGDPGVWGNGQDDLANELPKRRR